MNSRRGLLLTAIGLAVWAINLYWFSDSISMVLLGTALAVGWWALFIWAHWLARMSARPIKTMIGIAALAGFVGFSLWPVFRHSPDWIVASRAADIVTLIGIGLVLAFGRYSQPGEAKEQ